MSQVTPVAASVLVRDGKVLLIRRSGPPFSGLLSLPGGKIGFGETIEGAAVREFMEETGIKASFRRHLATIPEHVTENGRITDHMIIQLCELGYLGESGAGESEPVWVPIEDLDSVRREMTPSDYHMIRDILLGDDPGTWSSLIEKTANGYAQKEFRKL